MRVISPRKKTTHQGRPTMVKVLLLVLLFLAITLTGVAGYAWSVTRGVKMYLVTTEFGGFLAKICIPLALAAAALWLIAVLIVILRLHRRKRKRSEKGETDTGTRIIPKKGEVQSEPVSLGTETEAAATKTASAERGETPTPAAGTKVCAACGAVVTGKYCKMCGKKVVE